MQTKTKKRLSYKSKALVRSASSYGGMFKVLQLVQSAKTYRVGSVIANDDALKLLASTGKI